VIKNNLLQSNPQAASSRRSSVPSTWTPSLTCSTAWQASNPSLNSS